MKRCGMQVPEDKQTNKKETGESQELADKYIKTYYPLMFI